MLAGGASVPIIVTAIDTAFRAAIAFAAAVPATAATLAPTTVVDAAAQRHDGQHQAQGTNT